MKEEIWKDLIGFEGTYQVSNLGRIKTINSRHKTEKILKPALNVGGYPYVHITIVRNLHRLVARTFIPNPENKPHVNHKNGIKTDSSVENLEWVTRSENAIHSRDVLYGGNITKNRKQKFDDDTIRAIRNSYENENMSYKKLIEKYPANISTLWSIINRKTYKYVK